MLAANMLAEADAAGSALVNCNGEGDDEGEAIGDDDVDTETAESDGSIG